MVGAVVIPKGKAPIAIGSPAGDYPDQNCKLTLTTHSVFEGVRRVAPSEEQLIFLLKGEELVPIPLTRREIADLRMQEIQTALASDIWQDKVQPAIDKYIDALENKE